MYLFIRGSTNPGPRVTKIINFFESKKAHVVYLSPQRRGDIPNEKYRDLGSLGKFDYFDGKSIFSYIYFLFSVNLLIAKKIFINRKIIQLVHFSDLEVVLFGAVTCKILGIRFIYNIHDNFFQRYDSAMPISFFLKYLETLYICLSYKTLVPEEFRKTCYPKLIHSKISIIRNYPEYDVGCKRSFFKDKQISLFYAGWINPDRSINHFIDLAELLSSRGFKLSFDICGWGNKGYIEALSKKSEKIDLNFNYLGQLSQKDVIERLKQADISIAFYNPNKKINIHAASNKIPEILGSSTILITNEQTEIAKKIKPLNISLQYRFSVKEIEEDLIALIEDNELMMEFNNRAYNFYKSEYDPKLLISKHEEIFDEFF